MEIVLIISIAKKRVPAKKLLIFWIIHFQLKQKTVLPVYREIVLKILTLVSLFNNQSDKSSKKKLSSCKKLDVFYFHTAITKLLKEVQFENEQKAYLYQVILCCESLGITV